MAVNSWGSDASTVVVPHTRPWVTSTQTQEAFPWTPPMADGTDSTEASPRVLNKSPGWTQLVAEKARELERRDRAPSEPSLEDDVKVAQMILQPVSESLEKLRCSIEASTPRLQGTPPRRLSPRSARVSFSPEKAASPHSSISLAPALLRPMEEASDAGGSTGDAGDAFSSTLDVLKRLDSQLCNLESILGSLDSKSTRRELREQ
eukprot:g15904.t1